MGKFEKDTGTGRFFKDFKKYHGLPVQDAIFFNQSDLICDMAKHEDFIVMGRCADVILTNNHIPHISIFITAPFEQRLRRAMELHPGLSAKKAKHLLKNSKKLIVLKAFTKLYGMAGVRLGYALSADTALLEQMQACGQPWGVSSLAQAAGLAALEETAYVEKVRALIAEQRPRLAAGLRALGLRVLDGRANYLLFQAPETLGEALRQRGAVLRSCANYPGLGPGWYRTAVRTGPENEQLLKLLAEVLK